MNVWPFIEAEKAGHHGVKRACDLLEVSRAAYYQWSAHIPCARALSDAELTERTCSSTAPRWNRSRSAACAARG